MTDTVKYVRMIQDLRICAGNGDYRDNCSGCSYNYSVMDGKKPQELADGCDLLEAHAADMIEELLAVVAQLENRLDRAGKEFRMLITGYSICGICTQDRVTCNGDEHYGQCDRFEWHGVKELGPRDFNEINELYTGIVKRCTPEVVNKIAGDVLKARMKGDK